MSRDIDEQHLHSSYRIGSISVTCKTDLIRFFTAQRRMTTFPVLASRQFLRVSDTESDFDGGRTSSSRELAELLVKGTGSKRKRPPATTGVIQPKRRKRDHSCSKSSRSRARRLKRKMLSDEWTERKRIKIDIARINRRVSQKRGRAKTLLEEVVDLAALLQSTSLLESNREDKSSDAQHPATYDTAKSDSQYESVEELLRPRKKAASGNSCPRFFLSLPPSHLSSTSAAATLATSKEVIIDFRPELREWQASEGNPAAVPRHEPLCFTERDARCPTTLNLLQFTREFERNWSLYTRPSGELLAPHHCYTSRFVDNTTRLFEGFQTPSVD